MFIKLLGIVMKFLKYFLIILAAVVVIGLVITLFFLPSSIHVEKKTEIKTPASVVYAQINNFKNWDNWMPWLSLDTKMKKTYSEPAEGAKAFFEYASEIKEIGNGKITILESKPGEYIRFSLTMNGKDAGTAEFKFEEKEGKTIVTWTMDSDLGLFARWCASSLEEMGSRDFERGLAGLKKVCEEGPAAGEIEITVTEFKKSVYLAIHDSAGMDPKVISGKYAAAYKEIYEFMQKNQVQPAGAPISITNSYDEKSFNFNAAAPFLPPFKAKLSGRVILDSIPDCKVVKAVHKGPYDNLTATYNAVMKYIADNKLTIAGRPWEEYMTDPGTTKPQDMVTNIFFPVK